jgi:hypothetical protein
MAELNHFLVMATRTKPSAPTTERQNIFVIAIGTLDAGKPFAQIAAFEVIPYHMRNDRPEKAVLLLKKIVIALLEFPKVAIEEFPQGGFPRFSSPVYPQIAAAFHLAPLLPAKEQG